MNADVPQYRTIGLPQRLGKPSRRHCNHSAKSHLPVYNPCYNFSRAHQSSGPTPLSCRSRRHQNHPIRCFIQFLDRGSERPDAPVTVALRFHSVGFHSHRNAPSRAISAGLHQFLISPRSHQRSCLLFFLTPDMSRQSQRRLQQQRPTRRSSF